MTLDETYVRMLKSISASLRRDAVALLQWISYTQAPMSLAELTEATTIDPSGQGTVDVADRGQIEDVVDVLGGLVTVIYCDDLQDLTVTIDPTSSNLNQVTRQRHRKLQPQDKIRFAHFSVKEFLESNRVLLPEN